MSEPDRAARLEHDGNLEPARLDVARPPRQRKAKKLPEPSPELKGAAPAMLSRAKARPIHPGIRLEPVPGGDMTQVWTGPHNDRNLWELQLADALGTRSQAVIKTIIGQLEKLTADWWDEDRWRLDENELSTSIAIISATKPRNELEAVQAAQMVAVHLMQMRIASHVLKYPADTKAAHAAAKLANAFSGQVDAMQNLRGKRRSTRQSIKVTKETHYHAHRHDHPAPKGVHLDNRQSHEPAGAAAAIIDQRSPVRCQDEGGNVVPLASAQGQGSMRSPRRTGGGA